VVFDLVVNHTSRDHPAFQLHSAGVEAYADHYSRVPERDDTDVDWAGDGAPEFYFNWARIPNVNYDSLAVREWMLDVVDEWSPVVDGFRCDVAWGVPTASGRRSATERSARPRLPPARRVDPARPRRTRERVRRALRHRPLPRAPRGRPRRGPADAILDALDETARKGFPDPALHMRYVENHDETRYATECDESALGAATAATFTLPGIPMIYYGQERGVTEQRGTMRWHDGDADLTAFHRSLSTLRDTHPVLRRGRTEPSNSTTRAIASPATHASALARRSSSS